jgi:hypothetical protein
MAGSRLRKLRKTGAIDPSGEIVVIPRLPPMTAADKPLGWNQWSPAEKIEYLLGMSLDRAHDYLSWRPDEIDPHRLAAQKEVVRLVTTVAARLGVEAHRERSRAATLEDLAQRYKASSANGAASAK